MSTSRINLTSQSCSARSCQVLMRIIQCYRLESISRCASPIIAARWWTLTRCDVIKFLSGNLFDLGLLGLWSYRFQYLEYPASRGKIHISSKSPYQEPFFDSGFMNHKADFAPIRWSYKVTREVARRMDGMWQKETDGCLFSFFADDACLILQPSVVNWLLIIRTSTQTRLLLAMMLIWRLLKAFFPKVLLSVCIWALGTSQEKSTMLRKCMTISSTLLRMTRPLIIGSLVTATQRETL